MQISLEAVLASILTLSIGILKKLIQTLWPTSSIMKKFGIIVITNQVISIQDIGIIKKVPKEFENINQDLIKSSHLLQSKLYLKILDLSYYLENTNNSITSELVKGMIKKFHIFNDITPISKL